MSTLSLLVLLVHLGAPPPAEAAAPAAAPTEVVVGRRETLAQVAARTLGDARAAGELRALNALPSDEVRPGMRLRLPGPARARAQSALSAARAAITQRDAGSSVEAHARLTEAERLFLAARYDEAAEAADGAWALVSGASSPVHFTVSVNADAGVTEVESHAGMPVRVEAQGTTRTVKPGQRLRVVRGQVPPGPVAAPAVATPAAAPARLPAPQLLSPARFAVLQRAPARGGLAPVTVRWAPVKGAEGYAVEVAAEGGRTWTVEARGTQAALPPLPAGRYGWRVWALQAQSRGEAGPTRTFTLEEERLELDVKGTPWK